MQPAPMHFQWANPAPGLLGPHPTRPPTQAHATSSVSSPADPHLSSVPPPWAWSGTGQQPTALPQLFSTMSLNEPVEWVMDTGATDHVHKNESILHSFVPHTYSRAILVGNGSQMPVTKTGHTHFPIYNPHRPLHLHNVLISPSINLCVNLLVTIKPPLNLTNMVLLSRITGPKDL